MTREGPRHAVAASRLFTASGGMIPAMTPRTVTVRGREYGNAAAVAEITGHKRKTYQYYVAKRLPAANPAPKHSYIDDDTGEKMYDLGHVREWMDRRIGSGNTGAKRLATCTRCLRQGVPVTWSDNYYRHRAGSKRTDPWCLNGGEPAPPEEAPAEPEAVGA